MEAILALIAALIGGTALRSLEYSYSKREVRKEAESWTKAHGTTRIALSPEHNDEDRAWVSSMLEAGGLEIPVLTLCSCGYGEDCLMHCNHERHPDCKGPSYFELNPDKIKPAPRRLAYEASKRSIPSGQGSGSISAEQKAQILDRGYKYNAVSDTVIMTQNQAEKLRRQYAEHKTALNKMQAIVDKQKETARQEKVEAFKAKAIARHQNRLKEIYGGQGRQLPLPFDEPGAGMLKVIEPLNIEAIRYWDETLKKQMVQAIMVPPNIYLDQNSGARYTERRPAR